jgi:hypothetical protein
LSSERGPERYQDAESKRKIDDRSKVVEQLKIVNKDYGARYPRYYRERNSDPAQVLFIPNPM